MVKVLKKPLYDLKYLEYYFMDLKKILNKFL